MIIDFDYTMINLIIISAQLLQLIKPPSLYLSLSLLRAKMNLSSAIQALDKKSKDAFAGLTNAFPEGNSQEDRLHSLTKQASCILLPVSLFVTFISFYLFSSITYYISSISYL